MIIFVRFLNSQIYRSREIRENENLPNITSSTVLSLQLDILSSQLDIYSLQLDIFSS